MLARIEITARPDDSGLPFSVVSYDQHGQGYGECRCSTLTKAVNEIAAKINRGDLARTSYLDLDVVSHV